MPSSNHSKRSGTCHAVNMTTVVGFWPASKEFWPAQHGSQTCPFLFVVNWRDAIFTSKDQSMYMEFWIRQICCLRKRRSHLFGQAHRGW
jgi:hypothetical protein